jgi:hypothetical protein
VVMSKLMRKTIIRWVVNHLNDNWNKVVRERGGVIAGKINRIRSLMNELRTVYFSFYFKRFVNFSEFMLFYF